MKKVGIVIGLAVAGAVIWRAFLLAPPPAPPSMADMGPMPVSVAAVLSRQVTEYREYSGRLQAVEQAAINPRVDGTIEAVHFTEGALVKKGDLLFTLDPRPFEAALKKAEAMLASARAQADYTKKDYERSVALLKDEFVARRDFDARRNAAHVAEADLTGAEAAVRTAKLNLEYTQIRAPISGRVSRAEITVGNVVQTMPAVALLTTIVSINPVYVDFAMDEPTYMAYVRAGQTTPDKAHDIAVEISLAGEHAATHRGVVKAFDNQLNVASGTIRVRAELDNADGSLVPGMYALAKIAVPNEGASLLVADRAVNTDQSKKFVFVVDAKNIATYRPVELGGVVDGLRIIKSGVQAGDKIIVNGLQRAHPGAPVIPVDVPMDAPPEAPAGAAPPAPTPEQPVEAKVSETPAKP